MHNFDFVLNKRTNTQSLFTIHLVIFAFWDNGHVKHIQLLALAYTTSVFDFRLVFDDECAYLTIITNSIF